MMKIVAASQQKKEQKKSLSKFVDNRKHQLGLESARAALYMQISYLYASDFPFKKFGKLAKQAETIRNYQKQVLAIIKRCLGNSQINSIPE